MQECISRQLLGKINNNAKLTIQIIRCKLNDNVKLTVSWNLNNKMQMNNFLEKQKNKK